MAQTAGNIVQWGGSALTGGALASSKLAREGYNQANMAYNSYKIGKKYDQLVENPFQGSGADIIARMKNHNGEPVVLQRGEAIRGPNGEVIVHGKTLERETGTLHNYGLDKGIYRHNINRSDAQRIPRIIQNKPTSISQRGQYIYNAYSKNGNFQVVTSPTKSGTTISSTYYLKK